MYEDALDSYERALEINPNSQAALDNVTLARDALGI